MEPPKRRRSATRARLLEGALEVFAERGLHGASVEDICDRAGFTRGAFYSNFASKEELALALLQATMDQLLDKIRALLPTLTPADPATSPPAQAPPTLPGSVLQAVLALLDDTGFDSRQWHLITTEFTLHALRDPEAAQALTEQRGAFLREATRVVESVSAASGIELGVPAEQFVRMVIALHEGARTQSLLEPDRAPAGDLERTFLPMVLDAISRPVR